MFHCRVNFRKWDHKRTGVQDAAEREFKSAPLAPIPETNQSNAEVSATSDDQQGTADMFCSRYRELCMSSDSPHCPSGKQWTSQGQYGAVVCDDRMNEETASSSGPTGLYPASSSIHATQGSHRFNGADAAIPPGGADMQEFRTSDYHRSRGVFPAPSHLPPPPMTVKQLIAYGRNQLMSRRTQGSYPWHLESLFRAPLSTRHSPLGDGGHGPSQGAQDTLLKLEACHRDRQWEGEGGDWEWMSHKNAAGRREPTTGKGLGYRQALLKRGQHPLQRVLLVAVAAVSSAYSKAAALNSTGDKEEINRLQTALEARDHALALLRQELGHMPREAIPSPLQTSNFCDSDLQQSSNICEACNCSSDGLRGGGRASLGVDKSVCTSPSFGASTSFDLHESLSEVRKSISDMEAVQSRVDQHASPQVNEPLGHGVFPGDVENCDVRGSFERSGSEMDTQGYAQDGPHQESDKEHSCVSDATVVVRGRGITVQAEAELVECRWRCAAAIRRAKETALHVLHKEAAAVAAALGLVAELAQKLEQADMYEQEDPWQADAFPPGYKKEQENYRQIIGSALQDAVRRAVQNVSALQQAVSETWESLGPEALAALNLEPNSWMEFEAQHGADDSFVEHLSFKDMHVEGQIGLRSSVEWQSGAESQSGLESMSSALKERRRSSLTRPGMISPASTSRQQPEGSPCPSNVPRGEMEDAHGSGEGLETALISMKQHCSPFASCEKLCDTSRGVDGELALAVSEAVRKAMDSILRTSPIKMQQTLPSSLSSGGASLADCPEAVTEQLLSQLERAAAKVAGMEKEVKSLRRELHASEERVQRLQHAVEASLDREFKNTIQKKLDLAELTKQLSLQETADHSRQFFVEMKNKEILNLKEQCRLRDEAILELSLASNNTHETREQRLASLEEISRGKDITIALLKNKLAALEDQASAHENENRILRQAVGSSPRSSQQMSPTPSGESPIKRMSFFRKRTDSHIPRKAESPRPVAESLAQPPKQSSLRQALTGQIPLSALINKKLQPHHRRSHSMPNAEMPCVVTSTASIEPVGSARYPKTHQDPFDVASFHPYEGDFGTEPSNGGSPYTANDMDSVMSSRDTPLDFPCSPVLMEISQDFNSRRASTGAILTSPPKVHAEQKRSAKQAKDDAKRKRWIF